MAREVVAQGRFSLTVTKLNGESEKWEYDDRKVEIVDGKTVITRYHGSGHNTVTVLPEGATVTVDRT